MKVICEDQEERDKYEAHFKDHNRKRDYMHKFRPHTSAWNLQEDCDQEERVAHLLRHNADPNLAYVDGRIGKIVENISELGLNL